MALSEQQPMGLFAQLKSYNKTFWLANVMEMLERWAYYGVRLVLALFIVAAANDGGLEFTHIEKGQIFMWMAALMSFLPMFTGGLADRYGYKTTIAISVAMKIGGYAMMATQKEYWPFFAGCMLLAAGTGLFKPGVQGLIAHSVTGRNASVGWGMFYLLVNLGAFIAGYTAAALRVVSWDLVFYVNAAIVALNFVVLAFTSEPDVPREKAGGPLQVIAEVGRIMVVSIKDIMAPRLLIFILLFSGFWFSFHQLFDLLPNFIDDWVPVSSVPDFFKLDANTIAPEKILNLNSGMIMLTMIPVAFLASKMRALPAICLGIFASIIGILLAGSTNIGTMAVAGIIVFTIGEMLSSPRTNDYLASIAPADKKGAYLGYANVPSGVGWVVGSLVLGSLYEHHGDKVNFARAYLENDQGMTAEAVAAIPKEKVMETLAMQLDMTIPQATQMLWSMHHPERLWYLIAAVGAVSLVGMIAYDVVIRRIDANKELTKTVPAAGAEAPAPNHTAS